MTEQSDNGDYQKWQLERERLTAERFHDRNFEEGQNAAQAAYTNATFAFRTLILINGGAAIAILAFVGSLISSDVNPDDLTALTAPLMWFVVGIVAVGFSVAGAYFTNYCVSTAIGRDTLTWEHPYIERNENSEAWYWRAQLFQYFAVAAAFASLTCFIFGMMQIRDGLNQLG